MYSVSTILRPWRAAAPQASYVLPSHLDMDTMKKILLHLILLPPLLCNVKCNGCLQPCLAGSGSATETTGSGSEDAQNSHIDPFATHTLPTMAANTVVADMVSRQIEVSLSSQAASTPLSPSTPSSSATTVTSASATTVTSASATTVASVSATSVSSSSATSVASASATSVTSASATSISLTPLITSSEPAMVSTGVGATPSLTAVFTPDTTETTPLLTHTSTSQPSATATPSLATPTQGPSVTSNDMTATRSPNIFDIFWNFFEMLGSESRIGISVGAGVVVLLLIIVCLFCCCCICSRVRRRRRKGKVDLSNHRRSLTISNPIAMVSSSENHIGAAPARYRSTIHDSTDCPESYNVQELDPDSFNFPSSEYRETSVDDAESMYKPSQLTHATQPSQMTQMSTATDLFRQRSLPKLSPLSYSSQFLTAPQFPNNYPSLSIDENDPHSASGSRRQSLMALIPNPSPSLRVPTRMALSLKNEESKSTQGSKASVHGSRTSMQGSRLSVLGSRGSVQTGTGSRSQIYSSNLSSREHSSLLLTGPREFGGAEDDVVSLPLTGRGVSPSLKQNSLEEVPTRDSPLPDIGSHAISYSKKDFASLTCIPNRYAVEPDRLEDKKQLKTVPEKHTTEREGDVNKESPSEAKKKRTMSKLEKLTSLDYIRASLRLKKKKVSFMKTPESVPKHKQKSSKGNSNSKSKDEGGLTRDEDETQPPKDLLQSRRHSASGRTEFSPQHTASVPPNKFPDHFYYPQLSQPMYYGGGASMMHPAMFYQYPQLSQQYYAQLSQGGYAGVPYPPPALYQNNMMDPYGRSYGEPPTTRYGSMVTPELFDDIPEPEFYHKRDVLDQRQQQNGFNHHFPSPEHSSMQPSSPDQFTETSDTSSYLMQPPSAAHLHDDPLTSAHKHFMNEFAMDRDHHGYSTEYHVHVPTYPSDMMNRPQPIPEAYHEEYQPVDAACMSQDYDANHHMNGQKYTQYSGYSGAGHTAARKTSRSSYVSTVSDDAPQNDSKAGYDESSHYQENGEELGSSVSSSTKNRVSWSTEVIEYQRTPSDIADSDFDFNHF